MKEKKNTKKESTKKTAITEKKKGKTKKILLVSGGVVLAFLLFIGLMVYQDQKAMAKRREAMAVQRQVMVDHLKEEGLTDVEIEKKLAEQNMNRRNGDFEPSMAHQVLFTFRKATGTFPNGGNGEGRMQGGGMRSGQPGH